MPINSEINNPDNSGDTLLHIAARRGSSQTVSFLIEEGGDLNAQNNKGQTPLHLVEDEATFKVLIENGARFDLLDQKGRSAVWRELNLTFADRLQWILCPGIDMRMRYYSQPHSRPLAYEPRALPRSIEQANLSRKLGKVWDGYVTEIQRSILFNIRLDKNFLTHADSDGHQLIHHAVYRNKLDIFRSLMQQMRGYGLSVDHVNEKGNSLLHLVIEHVKDPQMLMGFINETLQDNDSFYRMCYFKNNKGDTPLHIFLKRRLIDLRDHFEDIINLLLSGHAQNAVNVRDQKCNTALHILVANNDTDLVEVGLGIILPLSDVNAKNLDRKTALNSVETDQVSIIRRLISAGAKLDVEIFPTHALSNRGFAWRFENMVLTAYRVLSEKSHFNRGQVSPAVQMPNMINYSSMLNSDKDLFTDLVNGIREGRNISVRHVQHMLHVSGDEGSLLHVAAQCGNQSVAQVLLNAAAQEGIDTQVFLNQGDASGRTPLHHAVEGGYLRFCQFLVEHGVDVNMYDAHRKTALFLLDTRKDNAPDICRLLIDRGFDITHHDRDGYSCLWRKTNRSYGLNLMHLLIKAFSVIFDHIDQSQRLAQAPVDGPDQSEGSDSVFDSDYRPCSDRSTDSGYSTDSDSSSKNYQRDLMQVSRNQQAMFGSLPPLARRSNDDTVTLTPRN